MARIFQAEDTVKPGELPPVPLGGTRQQALQRLQVGAGGVIAIVLLVGLAGMVQDRADVAQEAAVPEAAPTTEPSPTPTGADPLVEAGVVPDLPATPTPAATPTTGEARQGDLPPAQPKAGNAPPQ